MHSQLFWTVASMMILDSKSIAHAMGCACRKLLRDLSEYDLIQRIRAYSLATVRVTSRLCLHVQGSRLHVIVRRHSYDDIGSFTTYHVAAALDGSTDVLDFVSCFKLLTIFIDYCIDGLLTMFHQLRFSALCLCMRTTTMNHNTNICLHFVHRYE